MTFIMMAQKENVWYALPLGLVKPHGLFFIQHSLQGSVKVT